MVTLPEGWRQIGSLEVERFGKVSLRETWRNDDLDRQLMLVYYRKSGNIGLYPFRPSKKPQIKHLVWNSSDTETFYGSEEKAQFHARSNRSLFDLFQWPKENLNETTV